MMTSNKTIMKTINIRERNFYWDGKSRCLFEYTEEGMHFITTVGTESAVEPVLHHYVKAMET